MRDLTDETALERRLFRRLSTGEVVKPIWMLFSFPPWWHYDVLRGLDYLRSSRSDPDERCGEAIELVSTSEVVTIAGHWRTSPGGGPLRHGAGLRATQPIKHAPRPGCVGLGRSWRVDGALSPGAVTSTFEMTTLRITVKPRSREATLTQRHDGTWVATVKSSPVDGKANNELCGLVARHFGVRRSQVRIKSGATARVKTVTVDPGASTG